MKTSENIDALIGAFAKAKSEIPSIPMTGRNPFFKNAANPDGSKYSTLTDLFNTANPVLSKHGLILTQCPHANEGRISVITTIFHSSGQWIQNEGTPLRPDKDTPQGIASSITYGKRQEAFAILGLAGDLDDDGNAADIDRPKPPDSSTNDGNSGHNKPKPQETPRIIFTGTPDQVALITEAVKRMNGSGEDVRALCRSYFDSKATMDFVREALKKLEKFF